MSDFILFCNVKVYARKRQKDKKVKVKQHCKQHCDVVMIKTAGDRYRQTRSAVNLTDRGEVR